LLILVAGTQILIVMMEIHALLTIVMRKLVVLIPPLFVKHPMLVIPSAVFIWWDVLTM